MRLEGGPEISGGETVQPMRFDAEPLEKPLGRQLKETRNRANPELIQGITHRGLDLQTFQLDSTGGPVFFTGILEDLRSQDGLGYRVGSEASETHDNGG